MRDPKRIKRMCKLLQKAWESMPDQRFGQFLSNFIVGDGKRLFYTEDYDWEKLLSDLAEEPMSSAAYKKLKAENDERANEAWDGFNRAVRDYLE